MSVSTPRGGEQTVGYMSLKFRGDMYLRVVSIEFSEITQSDFRQKGTKGDEKNEIKECVVLEIMWKIISRRGGRSCWDAPRRKAEEADLVRAAEELTRVVGWQQGTTWKASQLF